MPSKVSPLPTEEKFLDTKYQLVKSLATGAIVDIQVYVPSTGGPLPKLFSDIADVIQVTVTSDPGNSTSMFPLVNGIPLSPGQSRTFAAQGGTGAINPQTISVVTNGQKLYADYLVRRK